MHPSLQLWDLEALYYSQFRDWEVRPSVRPPDGGKAASAQPLPTSRQADSQSENPTGLRPPGLLLAKPPVPTSQIECFWCDLRLPGDSFLALDSTSLLEICPE